MLNNLWTLVALAAADSAAPAAAGSAAAGADAGGGSSSGGMLGAVLPLVAMFAIFYFLLIRPQQKRQKQHQEFIKSLKRGSEVVLNSGIMGRIAAITDNLVLLEISGGVRIRVQRGQIAAQQSEADVEAGRFILAAASGGGGKKGARGKVGREIEVEDDASDGDGETDDAEPAADAADKASAS